MSDLLAEIQRLKESMNELRTILLVMMEPEAAERFRRSWFPRAEDE